jgi:GntR family transcriptional regulator, rspAB operon transcriptional repressor
MGTACCNDEGVPIMMRKKLVIQRTDTIRKKVYSHLREQILRGEYMPNERLFETKISEEIGASRTPVREALHSLELEGLIECLPKVGYAVKPISDQEVAEICEIRGTIEGLAARWAAEKAREKLIEELQKNIGISEAKTKKGEARSFIELDAQFHEIIARLSGSKRLLELAQTLRHHMLRYRAQSIYSTENVVRAIEGHKGILASVEKGEMDGITLAIQKHLDQAKKDILRFAFKEHEEKKEINGKKASRS